MAHQHTQSHKIKNKGFAALYLITIISFTLFSLLLTTQASSLDSRDAFMEQARQLEKEHALQACVDLETYANQRGDKEVDCYSFFLSSLSSLRSRTPK